MHAFATDPDMEAKAEAARRKLREMAPGGPAQVLTAAGKLPVRDRPKPEAGDAPEQTPREKELQDVYGMSFHEAKQVAEKEAGSSTAVPDVSADSAPQFWGDAAEWDGSADASAAIAAQHEQLNAALDAGFDVAYSNASAWYLECVPPREHFSVFVETSPRSSPRISPRS